MSLIILMIIYYQFGTIQNLQRVLIHQTSNWSGNICGCFLQQTSYNKDAEIQPKKKAEIVSRGLCVSGGPL
jgi:hypothetical protein